MSTAVMMGRIAEVSPRPSARITGIVYFLYFLTAVLGEGGPGLCSQFHASPDGRTLPTWRRSLEA